MPHLGWARPSALDTSAVVPGRWEGRLEAWPVAGTGLLFHRRPCWTSLRLQAALWPPSWEAEARPVAFPSSAPSPCPRASLPTLQGWVLALSRPPLPPRGCIVGRDPGWPPMASPRTLVSADDPWVGRGEGLPPLLSSGKHLGGLEQVLGSGLPRILGGPAEPDSPALSSQRSRHAGPSPACGTWWTRTPWRGSCKARGSNTRGPLPTLVMCLLRRDGAGLAPGGWPFVSPHPPSLLRAGTLLCCASLPVAAHPVGPQVRRNSLPLVASLTSEWGAGAPGPQTAPHFLQPFRSAPCSEAPSPIMRQNGFSPGCGLPCACPAPWPSSAAPISLCSQGPTRGRPTTTTPEPEMHTPGSWKVRDPGKWLGSGRGLLGWAARARSGHGKGQCVFLPAWPFVQIWVPVPLPLVPVSLLSYSSAPHLSLLPCLSPGHPFLFPSLTLDPSPPLRVSGSFFLPNPYLRPSRGQHLLLE